MLLIAKIKIQKEQALSWKHPNTLFLAKWHSEEYRICSSALFSQMYVLLWKTALNKDERGLLSPLTCLFFFFFKKTAALMCKRCLLLALTVCCRKLVSLERNLLRFPDPLNWVLFMTEHSNLLTESNFFSPPPFLFAPELISSQKVASLYFSCFWEWQVLHTHVINTYLLTKTLLDSKNEPS